MKLRDLRVEDLGLYLDYELVEPVPEPIPVDCVLGDWSAWGPHPADPTLEIRTRAVLIEPANGGAPCGPLEETRPKAVEPPPPPPPPPSSDFPQYLVDDGGRYGPDRQYWSRELQARWAASQEVDSPWRLGNWLDAQGESQGLVPYATLQIGPETPLGYIEADITPLARKWVETGHNRGVYLRSESSPTWTAHAYVDGRLGAQPPMLRVVTSDGTIDVPGTLAGWFTSTVKSSDTRRTAKLTKGAVGLLHFPLDAITGDLVSATLRLGLTGRHSSAVLPLEIMETDPPYIHVGGDGGEVELGLAAEVGEDNLAAHPDVFAAGDMRPEHVYTFRDSNGRYSCNRERPTPLLLWGSCPSAEDIPGYEVEWVTQPDGSIALRASFVHGSGRIVDTSGPSFVSRPGVLPDFEDPTLSIPLANVHTRMFARAELLLEEDFVSTTDGIKGGLGFDARCGYWRTQSGGYWQNTTGNSGTKGTGRKVLRANDGALQAEYQGHSMRMHFDRCLPSGTPYQKYRPILMMVSHNGPFDYAHPYGTEEIRRCGTVVMEKGRWHCIEWELSLNSVVGPFDGLGNGVGVRDGIMRLWVDGVRRWEKTDFVFRVHPELSIEAAWMVWVHGGTTPPAINEILHYQMNRLVVAKRYIGPTPRATA